MTLLGISHIHAVLELFITVISSVIPVNHHPCPPTSMETNKLNGTVSPWYIPVGYFRGLVPAIGRSMT